MNTSQGLSLIATEVLAGDETSDQRLLFEPYNSHFKRGAVEILITDCNSDAQKKEIFKYNLRVAVKKYYEHLQDELNLPNRAILELISTEVINHTTLQAVRKNRQSFPEKEWNAPLKTMDFDPSEESIRYNLLHIASFILDEQELKQIQLTLPDTKGRTCQQQFLIYEIALLRLKALVLSENVSIYFQQTFLELKNILGKMMEEYEKQFERVHDHEARILCLRNAEIQIQCYWILASKMCLDGKMTDMISIFSSIQSPEIVRPMVHFWFTFPSEMTSLHDRRNYHHALVSCLLSVYGQLDCDIIDHLICLQRIGLSGVIPKTFVLYHALNRERNDFAEFALNFTDANNFPPPNHPDVDFSSNLIRERAQENYSIGHFEAMWESIMSHASWRSHTNRVTAEKIVIRGVISDLEAQINWEFNKMEQLAKRHLFESANHRNYKEMLRIIHKNKIPDAAAAGITSTGYKLIANMQLQHFAHFVNLNPLETKTCFELTLEILEVFPEFANSRTIYEVICLCLQNTCLHRDLNERNVIAREIERILKMLMRPDDCENFHAMNHFLLLLAKVLRSHSSEDMMRKTKAKDSLMKGLWEILLELETQMQSFDPSDIYLDDSHFQPTHTGFSNIQHHRCQAHLTCLCIITFCDQTHVFNQSKIWFEALSRVLKMEKSLIQCYSQLLIRNVLTNSTTFPVPQSDLLDTIRNLTPAYLLRRDKKDTLTERNNLQLQLLFNDDSPMSQFLIHRLNGFIGGGLLVPTLVNVILNNFNDPQTRNNYTAFLNTALDMSWSSPVQHEDMEYITTVSGSQKYFINVYMQFKVRDELDGSERVVVTVGDCVITFTCSHCSEKLSCFFTANDRNFVSSETPVYKVHKLMFQLKSSGQDGFIITSDRQFKIENLTRNRPIDEVKISVSSLHHTIPVIFQGDCQSLVDVHEFGVTPKNIEKVRRIVQGCKGRRLNIGQVFHPVIPVRHSQTIVLRTEQRGFESTVEQLRAAGGFGFIFHSFTKMLLNDSFENGKCLTEHWRLLLTYLNSPCTAAERFTRHEALQLTSLLFRFPDHKVPETIIMLIFDKCMTANEEIKEAVLLTELLSEPTYWEKDLQMFYLLLVRFKSTNPGIVLDRLLPLILHIVAIVIRKDQGTDEVHDIVTITVEIFKDWCREPHSLRTAQLVTFMMDLFDLEKISPQFDKFRWVEESVLEREQSRQPILTLNGDEPESDYVTKSFNLDLLQLDLPLGHIDDDELFRVLTPSDVTSTERDVKLMARNRDYMMKGLLQIIHQTYVLCPDNQYACFDTITAEKICYLIEVNSNGKVVGLLIEMYEAIINHNIYSDKITKIFQLNLLLILARQLRKKPLTLQTVNALFSILLREQVDVSAGLDTAHLEAFSPNAISCQSVYPLLTVLEESADDVDIAVFTVVCTSLNKVYIHNNQLTQALTAAGVDEHMAAILLKLARIGDFRIRNEKLKALLDPWFAFAISIMRIGVNGKKSVFDGTSRLVSHLLLLYTQENGKLLDNPNNEAQRLLRDNVYWTLCVLLLQLFKFLLDIALADSNKHRSASNSSLHMMGFDEEPEEIEAAPTKPTKFWDEIAQKVKESVLGPNQNLLKCQYRKHKESPLTAEEIRHRIKDVLTLCQYFFKITNRVECDEEDTLFKIFFDELAKWALEEAWPNCIWVAADMMFITNVFANCAAFVMTDIHQYITPFRKVFNRQKTTRIEVLLQKIIRSHTKISTVFGNVMDIDQMIRLTMENITQREDHNSNVFKLAVLFLNSPSRNRKRNAIEYPQPRTPDLIQRMTVDSEIASRFWLDQRNDVISRIYLKGRTPQPHFDVGQINLSLERLQKAHAAPRNMKRVNEVCELMRKVEENERVFSRLTSIQNDYKPRKITTILGPRGERMVTDFTEIKTQEMFVNSGQHTKTSIFRDVFQTLSLERIRKPDVFSNFRNSCFHGVLHSNGVQTNPVFYVHRAGITALPGGSHIVEKTYLFEEMTLIFKRPMRPWDVLEVSFEILLKTHETILIYSQQRFAKLVVQFGGKLIANENQLLSITKQWEEGKMSNFEYLTMLNLFSGRTIHDSSAYPIFPRIITRFGDESIDLLDKGLYRKLDRPVAAQDNVSIEKHRQHYHELKENEGTSHLTPYHFGSMCSNRGVVSFFNIRLLPFGEEAIELQDGRFDFPDRLFHNIESGMGMGKVESSNDYKELVPELFTTPEVLRNENGNLFGERQNGEPVEDVEIPAWCNVDEKPVHENFIHVHRHALESEHVQSMLHHWIDLVFGYKSRGRAALDAVNVYHPAVYPGSSPPPAFDRVMTNAYEANQKTLGNAPIQLFHQPHPKREVVQFRHGSVRSIHGLAFGKELTVSDYEVSEVSGDRQATQRVWKKMKILKSKIFNKSDKSESENIQLFKRVKDKKEHDPSEVNVKIKDNTLTLSDGTTEAKKQHSKKVVAVSVDDKFVACLMHQGPIELYKMIYKQRVRTKADRMLRGDGKVLDIEYFGTIPVQEGHYCFVEICSSFSSIFTAYLSNGKTVVSVWSLYSHHVRARCFIDGVMESCGILKNFGELILVEKWNGEQVRYQKLWSERKRSSKKLKYRGKTGIHDSTEQIMAKISINANPQLSKYTDVNKFIHHGVISTAPEPGMGIQTLAMIRSDHCIVLFETLSLTVMRVLEVDDRQDFCLRELRFQEDKTLIAIFKETRAMRKKNKELYKNLGCAPPVRTWRIKPK